MVWAGGDGMTSESQGVAWLVRSEEYGSRLTWAGLLPTLLEFEMNCRRASPIEFPSEES